MLLGVLLVVVADAFADDPGLRLDNALRLYAQGDTAAARLGLQELIGEGTILPGPVRQAALAYLGDILYSEEGPDAARPFFSALLAESPQYVMDPFEHPQPVCDYFEVLRSARAAPTPVATRTPPPWLSMVPGGVYWFGNGKVGAGFAVAATQAGLLATNLVLTTDRQTSGKVPQDNPEALAAFEARRLAQNLTAGGFYLSLLLPPAIEFSRWSAESPRAALTVGPGSLIVSGTF